MDKENVNPVIFCRLLGAKKGNFQGNDYYTLSVRLADDTVGDMTGQGSFDFAPFKDKDVLLTLELRKNNGRFGVRAVSAVEAKVGK